MKKYNKLISENRIKRIREQGYFNYSDIHILDLAFGNRLAYQLCSAILIVGVATASVKILSVMFTIAFLGVILPNHPFDYIYNYGIRRFKKIPKLPPRSQQLKFACTVATLWIGITIFSFHNSHNIPGYIM